MEQPVRPDAHTPASGAGESQGPAVGARLVGIGASAGGLEALRELMDGLIEHHLLAYVIAQHVSPSHVSMLQNLLAPRTDLQVANLEDGEVPRAGTVYITPPNRDVTYQRGQLRLTEPSQAVGPKPSVDHFFQSLAEGLGDQAIAVILSGTGSDGAAGLRAVKAAGGITLAQDPDTAKYDGMPRAAIHTGSVDLILRPMEMGQALSRLVAHEPALALLSRPDSPEDDFAHIGKLVRLKTAFRLDDYKAGTVRRRIARRLQILGIDSLSEYSARLAEDPEEAQALVRDTFISVTSFFRDTDAFQALGQAVDALVRRLEARAVIRCWVPACATGEEAYSVAMLIEEALARLGRTDLQYMIFASDLDDEALERARQGIYPVADLAHLPEALRERYTDPVGGYCHILKSVRNRLVFARQNVIEDPPFARLDLISCRNLLIYLNPPVQKRVLELFHYSLCAGGMLFLGKSESAESYAELYRPIDARARLYQRVEGITSYALPVPSGLSAPAARRPFSARNKASTTDAVSVRTLEALAQRFAPPSLVINEVDDVVHFQGNLKPFLGFPTGAANMHLFDLVDSNARAELRALVYRCRRDQSVVRSSALVIDIDGVPHRVSIELSPLDADAGQMLLVSFLSEPVSLDTPRAVPADGNAQDGLIISELEQELSDTRAHLHLVVQELETSNEELQSLNEELQSTNEELQSTNEELQTSNEELQSTNEELLTVNEELQVKSGELETTATDLTNVKQSLSFPLIVVDTHLRITQANRACAAIVATETPLEGCSLTGVHWRMEAPGLSVRVRQVLANGQPHAEVLLSDDGRAFRLDAMAYRTAAGAIDGAVLVFEDITRQRLAEQALAQSNERFDLAVRGSNDGLWDWEIADDQLYFSPRFEEMLGYREHELEASLDAWVSRLHPEDKPAVLAAIEAHLKQNVPYEIEYRLRHKSGGYIWVLARGEAVRNSAGEAVRMAGSISDTSRRKHVELALRESEAHNRALIEAAPDAVVVIDQHGRMVQCNPACARVFGYDAQALLGNNVAMLMADQDTARHDGFIQRFLTRGNVAPSTGRDVLGRHKDGHDIQLHLSIGVQRLGGGEVRFIGFLRDLTERGKAEAVLRESQLKFQQAMRFAPIGMALVTPEGRWVEFNAALCQIVGYSADELTGMSFLDLSLPEDRDLDRAEVRKLLDGALENYAVEKRYRHRDGRLVWVGLNVSLVPGDEGGARYFIVQIQDITRRKRDQDELHLAASVFSSTMDGIFIATREGKILKVNRAFEHITGYSDADAVGQDCSLWQSDRHDEEFHRGVRQCVTETGAWQGEVWNRHKAGHLVPVWLSLSCISGESGSAARMIGVMYDISEQKTSQERINHLAHYDGLTGLPNRSLFMDRLGHALAQANRQGRKLALMFIDLDNFKHINDTYGHPVGDELLVEVGERLRAITRASDTVARLSGDEFTVLIENADDADAAETTARKILHVLSDPVEVATGPLYVSASIGVAFYPEDGGDVDTLVKNADLAMYRSKDGGRNQFHFYTQDMASKAEERMTLHNELREAVDQHTIEVYYQPVVDVATRRCVGVEALARWPHGERGSIAPARFIPVAEERGLIHPLGDWVFRQTCEQYIQWREAGVAPDFVSVNVSGKQVAQRGFVDAVLRMLDEIGCSPEDIVLELTESYLMHESADAISLLNLLRDIGFGIAIDDFGTGYSSLAYLKRLPVTKLKLDQSFVRDIPEDRNDIAIARSILRLGDTLGLEVIAEGVETEAQHDFVLNEGCSLSQGFYYAQPMSGRDFIAYMREQQARAE